MKKTLLILAGIGLLCFLLIGRLFMKQRSGFGEEREWFAKAVRYEFSAQVVSVELYNENSGKLWCRLTSGNPQIHREDSLKPFFKEHDMLYFIFQQEGDSILFIAPNAGLVTAGDSVSVSSENNSIEFFRDSKPMATDQLSNTLTGFGRPFFMKRKD